MCCAWLILLTLAETNLTFDYNQNWTVSGSYHIYFNGLGGGDQFRSVDFLLGRGESSSYCTVNLSRCMSSNIL